MTTPLGSGLYWTADHTLDAVEVPFVKERDRPAAAARVLMRDRNVDMALIARWDAETIGLRTPYPAIAPPQSGEGIRVPSPPSHRMAALTGTVTEVPSTWQTAHALIEVFQITIEQQLGSNVGYSGAPVFNRDGDLLGVVIAQVPLNDGTGGRRSSPARGSNVLVAVPVVTLLSRFADHLPAIWSSGRPRLFTVPPPPAGALPRDELVRRIMHALDENRGPVSLFSLRGHGGMGKTIAAQLACHHRELWERFSDGILWVTVGERADVPSRMSELSRAIAGAGAERAGSDRVAIMDFFERNPNSLLVLDDVWDVDDLEQFLALVPSAVGVLMTTRGLRPADAHTVLVEEFSPEEATAVLVSRLPFALRDAALEQRDAVATIIRELYGWPLLVDLAARELATAESAESLRAAVDDLASSLEGDPTALDAVAPEARSLRRMLERSLGNLREADRVRWQELAAFPTDTDFDVSMLEDVWGVETREARASLDRLRTAGLLTDTSVPDAGKLHDVFHSFINSGLGAEATAVFTRVWRRGAEAAITPDGRPGALTRSRCRWLGYHVTQLGDVDAVEQTLTREWLEAFRMSAGSDDLYLSHLDTVGYWLLGATVEWSTAARLLGQSCLLESELLARAGSLTPSLVRARAVLDGPSAAADEAALVLWGDQCGACFAGLAEELAFVPPAGERVDERLLAVAADVMDTPLSAAGASRLVGSLLGVLAADGATENRFERALASALEQADGLVAVNAADALRAAFRMRNDGTDSASTRAVRALQLLLERTDAGQAFLFHAASLLWDIPCRSNLDAHVHTLAERALDRAPLAQGKSLALASLVLARTAAPGRPAEFWFGRAIDTVLPQREAHLAGALAGVALVIEPDHDWTGQLLAELLTQPRRVDRARFLRAFAESYIAGLSRLPLCTVQAVEAAVDDLASRLGDSRDSRNFRAAVWGSVPRAVPTAVGPALERTGASSVAAVLRAALHGIVVQHAGPEAVEELCRCLEHVDLRRADTADRLHLLADVVRVSGLVPHPKWSDAVDRLLTTADLDPVPVDGRHGASAILALAHADPDRARRALDAVLDPSRSHPRTGTTPRISALPLFREVAYWGVLYIQAPIASVTAQVVRVLLGTPRTASWIKPYVKVREGLRNNAIGPAAAIAALREPSPVPPAVRAAVSMMLFAEFLPREAVDEADRLRTHMADWKDSMSRPSAAQITAVVGCLVAAWPVLGGRRRKDLWRTLCTSLPNHPLLLPALLALLRAQAYDTPTARRSLWQALESDLEEGVGLPVQRRFLLEVLERYLPAPALAPARPRHPKMFADLTKLAALPPTRHDAVVEVEVAADVRRSIPGLAEALQATVGDIATTVAAVSGLADALERRDPRSGAALRAALAATPPPAPAH